MSASDCSSDKSTDPDQLKVIGMSLVGLSVALMLPVTSLNNGIHILGLTVSPIALLIPVPILALSGAALAVWADISADEEGS